jgi:ribose transport system substrate-binding protein
MSTLWKTTRHFIMKKFYLFALALCAVVLFPGCDHKNDGSAAGSPSKKIRLGIVINAPSDYMSLVRLGCDFVVRGDDNIDLDFRIPTDATIGAQQEILSNFVASGVDGIAVSPIDADQQTDFLSHIATNTLLVCIDSDAEKSGRACYIGTDNVAAGRQAADLLKAALPQGGKVVLCVGYDNAQNTKDRVKGLQDELAGSNIQIIDTLADDTKRAVAYKNAEDALAKYPDLAGMVGIYDYHGPAILTAVRGAGKTGQVKIVCFDEDSDTLAGVAAGDIYGTVVQNPFQIGGQTVFRLAKYLRGDKSQLAGGRIIISSQAVTKDNVVHYQNALKDSLSNPAGAQ